MWVIFEKNYVNSKHFFIIHKLMWMLSKHPSWCRTDCHGLPRLSRAPKKALVEIMGLGIEIVWNLASWSEMAF